MAAFNFKTEPQPVRQYGQDSINSGGFFPEILLDDLRSSMRIDNNITSDRLFHLAVSTVGYVNDSLGPLKARALKEGRETLVQTSDERINGVPLAEIRYRRAVYCYTAAALMETYADTSATGKSADRADAKQQQADDYRREGHYAIADLLGRGRIDSELL